MFKKTNKLVRKLFFIITIFLFLSCEEEVVKNNAQLILTEKPKVSGYDEFKREVFWFPVDTTGNGKTDLEARVWNSLRGKIFLAYAKRYWEDSISKNPHVIIVHNKENDYWQINGINQ